EKILISLVCLYVVNHRGRSKLARSLTHPTERTPCQLLQPQPLPCGCVVKVSPRSVLIVPASRRDRFAVGRHRLHRPSLLPSRPPALPAVRSFAWMPAIAALIRSAALAASRAIRSLRSAHDLHLYTLSTPKKKPTLRIRCMGKGPKVGR